MNNAFYTIQFRNKVKTWSYKDFAKVQDARFDTMGEAEKVINQVFQDQSVEEAFIVKWESGTVFHKHNESKEFKKAEAQIFDALYDLETPALRRRVLQKFLSHFEKLDPCYVPE
jgi:quinol monooxygenase YgiN